MSRGTARKVESTAQRIAAAIFGFVVGLVVGVLAGTLVIGFGDPLLVTIAALALAGAVSGWVWPAPYLTVAGILLSIVGVEI